MTRVAVSIMRALPNLASATDEQLAGLLDGWDVEGLPPLSRGEFAVLRFARVAEEMLGACDSTTIDAALEAVDQAREEMVS